MALIFILKVVPNSGYNAWKIDKSGLLKCYLKSLPERGKANLELIRLISKELKIPLNMIEVVAGATSRNKKIKIETNLNYANLLHILGLSLEQQTIF